MTFRRWLQRTLNRMRGVPLVLAALEDERATSREMGEVVLAHYESRKRAERERDTALQRIADLEREIAELRARLP
jgi:hypothetical protein